MPSHARTPHDTTTVKRSHLIGRLLTAIACAVTAALLVPGSSAAATSGAANFLGHWTDGGAGWVITSQDSSGGCSGTSDYGDGYTLTNCQVTGTSYAFDIDFSDWYVSHNTGTISGDTATGGFVDNAGHSASYTAYRTGRTATAVSCSPSRTGTFACTVRVTDATARGVAPTGTVTQSTTGGAIKPTSCTLKAGSCTFTYVPTARSNEKTTTITSSYLSDQPLRFGNSSGTRAIDPIRLTVSNKTVSTYIAFAQTAEFTLELSRASNVPVSVQATTEDGTGPYAAKAHDADYKRVDRKVMIGAGHLTGTVGVTVFPREDIRVDSNFRLKLADLSGADFAPAATHAAARLASSSASGASTPRDGKGPISRTVKETIRPHMLAGIVEDAVNLTDHRKPATLWVRRWDSKTFLPLKKGMKLYVGDEIMTHKDTVAALNFVIGGEVGINRGTRATVTSERSVREGDGGILSIIGHKIDVWSNINHEKSQKLLIQTNGGVMGIKG